MTDYRIAIDKAAEHYLKRRKISYIQSLFEKKAKEIFGDKKVAIANLKLSEFIALNEQLKKIRLQADVIYGTDTALKCAALYKIAETALFYCITRRHDIKYFIYPGKIPSDVANLRKRFIVNELGEDMFQWLGLESQALTNIKSKQKEKLGAFSESNFPSDSSDSDTSIVQLNLIHNGKRSLTPRHNPYSSPASSPKKLSKFSKTNLAELTSNTISLNNDDMSLLETYVWATGIRKLARDAKRLNVSDQAIVELCKKFPQEQSMTVVETNDKHPIQASDYSKNPFILLPPPKTNDNVNDINAQIINTNSCEATDPTQSNYSSLPYSVSSTPKSIEPEAKLSRCNIL